MPKYVSGKVVFFNESGEAALAISNLQVRVTVFGIEMSFEIGDEFWAYGYDRNFPYNENPSRAFKTTTLKCCLSSTNATDRRKNVFMLMEVQCRLMHAHFIGIYQNRQK